MSPQVKLPAGFRKLSSGQKRQLILALPGVIEVAPMRFTTPDLPDKVRRVHETFTALFPREWVRIQPMLKGEFMVSSHALGADASFSPVHVDVGFECPVVVDYFGTAAAAAQFAAGVVASNGARLGKVGLCKVVASAKPDGSAASFFYTPEAWSRAQKERRFPAFAWANAELAAAYLAYADELDADAFSPAKAGAFQRELAEKLGSDRPALVAAARAARAKEAEQK